MASPTLVPRFGGQSYRKLITVTLPWPVGAKHLKAGGAMLRLVVIYKEKINVITEKCGSCFTRLGKVIDVPRDFMMRLFHTAQLFSFFFSSDG